MAGEVVARHDHPLGRGLLPEALDAPVEARCPPPRRRSASRCGGARARRRARAARAAAPACSRGAGGRASRRSGRARGAAGRSAVRFRCGVLTHEASRPASSRARARAAKAASSGTCSSMSTTATRSNVASGNGQAVAADEVHVLADQRADGGDRLFRRGPPRPTSPPALAQQQAHDAVVGAEVEAAQPGRRAEHRRHLGELALLQDRAAEERHRPLALVSRAQPRRSSLRMTGEPRGRVSPSAEAAPSSPRASAADPSAAVEGHREEELRPRGRSAGSRAPRTPARPRRRAKTVNGRVSRSTPFLRPKKRSAAALTLRRVG